METRLMKKVKIAFWALVVAFLGLIVYQNQEFFLFRNRIGFNLGVIEPYTSPAIYNAVLFLGCFVVGFLLAYFSSLFDRFRANKIVRQLNATIEAQKKQIDSLTSELAQAKAHLPGNDAPLDVAATPPAEGRQAGL
jgi:hypothetical protein